LQIGSGDSSRNYAQYLQSHHVEWYDWARFIEEITNQYKHAKRITLVMDNLNTHEQGSLYHAFNPEKAKELLDRFEFVYTPKHGSR